MEVQPKAIVLINGKRKSGKDYFASALHDRLQNSEIIHLSNEIKREYAQLHNLNYAELLTDSPYKDKYRVEMIALGEARRAKDPAYYCAMATQHATKEIWIVVDNRRTSDIAYFKSCYPDLCCVVRVWAEDNVRRTRGWSWKLGVDNVESECGLDHYPSDVIVVNNDNEEDNFVKELDHVTQWCKNQLTKTDQRRHGRKKINNLP